MATEARNTRMEAVRALATAIIAEAICIGVGVFLFFMSFDVSWIVGGAIVGGLIAIPFVLKFHRLTKDRV